MPGPETSETRTATETSLGSAETEPGGAAPSHDDLAAGTLIGERFRVLRRVGAGGMGVVYLARDARLEREVAIKVHRARRDPAELEREAIAMARLAHPNVISVYEIGATAGGVFVAMEYVAGRTLREWMAEPRSWRDVIAMMRPVGQGLAAAHDAGLVHRDFKPENVLVGADGRPRVGDFGLARPATEEDDAIAGTPAYMAPEQHAGGAVDARADQFAFGVVLYEALFGRRPFAGTTVAEVRRAVETGAVIAPPRRAPRWLVRVVLRALATAPSDRFASMRALLDVIARGARRRRELAAAAGALVAVAAGVAIAAASRARGPGACETAAARIDGVWDEAARGSLVTAADADAAADVDRFAARWRSARAAACRDDDPHAASCLDGQLAELPPALAGAAAGTWTALPWTGRCARAGAAPTPHALGVDAPPGGAAISPDGTRVALVAAGRLSVVDVARTSSSSQALPAGAAHLAWARDGARIFYETALGLHALALATGASSDLASDQVGWISPDGGRLLTMDDDRWWVCDVPRRVLRWPLGPLRGAIAESGTWSPDGARFAATVLPPAGGGYEIRTLELFGVREGIALPVRLARTLSGNPPPIAWLDPRHVMVSGQRTTSEGYGVWVVDVSPEGDRDPPELAMGAPPDSGFDVLDHGGERTLARRLQIHQRLVRLGGAEPEDLPGYGDLAFAIALDDNGSHVLVRQLAKDRTVAWVSLSDGASARIEGTATSGVAYDGVHVVRLSQDGAVWHVDDLAADGSWRRRLDAPKKPALETWIACGPPPASRCVVAYLGAARSELRAIDGHTLGPAVVIDAPVFDVPAVAPDGRSMAFGSGGDVLVVDLEHGATERWPLPAGCTAQAPAFSRRDASIYVSAACGATFELLRLRHGQPTEILHQGPEWIAAPVIGADDQIVTSLRSFASDLVTIDGL